MFLLLAQYIFIYVSLVVFILGIIYQIRSILKTKKEVETNIFKIIINLFQFASLKKDNYFLWFTLLLLHLGIMFLVFTDTTFIINALAYRAGLIANDIQLIFLAKIFCHIGGILSFLGIILLIHRKMFLKKDFLFSFTSLIFAVIVEIAMWIAMFLHSDFLDFSNIVAALVTFTPVEVSFDVKMSTFSGAAFLAYIVFTKTTTKYLEIILKK
ncbi:MAG: hypothetical protein HQK51_10095 [Oligoflexia bacterium]|nr:hypothetical protein [Oligoflexia bacterium]